MIDLPLFPLNTVLFPGMPLNLHIFEERYKKMINQCLNGNRPFGVVLISSGQEALGPLADPHLIGCTAQITQAQPLRQGQMHITAIGRERFRIRSLDRSSEPYLIGHVDMYPLESEERAIIVDRGMRLRTWIHRYLKALEEAGQVQFDASKLPKEPTALAYLGAVVLQQISTEQKQELLEAPKASIMFDRLRAIYRREVALLEAMLSPPGKPDVEGPFSNN